MTTAPDGLFIEIDGDELQVTNMFTIGFPGDEKGVQTTDPARCLRCVAILPDGKWGVFTCLPGDVKKVEDA